MDRTIMTLLRVIAASLVMLNLQLAGFAVGEERFLKAANWAYGAAESAYALVSPEWATGLAAFAFIAWLIWKGLRKPI